MDGVLPPGCSTTAASQSLLSRESECFHSCYSREIRTNLNSSLNMASWWLNPTSFCTRSELKWKIKQIGTSFLYLSS